MYVYYLEQRSKLHNSQNNISQPSTPNNSYGPPVQINGTSIVIFSFSNFCF